MRELNRDNVDAKLVASWDEAHAHGAGAYYFDEADGVPVAICMVLPGPAGFRRIPIVKDAKFSGWAWDGNRECPTLTPSISASAHVEGGAPNNFYEAWHGYLTAGKFVSC